MILLPPIYGAFQFNTPISASVDKLRSRPLQCHLPLEVQVRRFSFSLPITAASAHLGEGQIALIGSIAF